MKTLVSICMGAMLCMLAACGGGPKTEMPYNKGIHIIPQPVSLTQGEGTFKLSRGASIAASTPESKKVAKFFASKMKQSTGFNITVSNKASSGDIELVIDPVLASVNNEGYTLVVSSKGVVIKAKTPQGLFYGMQSFLQLLPAEIESTTVVKNIDWTAPCVAVKDEPRFAYRGFMLDACRHFIPVENVKKQIDAMSMFKINRMHWHLTDDQGWRIEIKKYPKLTEIGSKRIDGEGTEYSGFYTQEQIKDVVNYAAERFVTIVPEIELPGHEMAAIAAYPELSCKGTPTTPRIIWGVEQTVMCPGKEDMFTFLENVIAEVAPLFPGEYFHIGGDECPKVSWEKCPLCQKRIREEGLKADKQHTAEQKLQSYVVQRIEKVLNEKYHKKMIGWDEILEGGVSPTATVMSWRGEQGGITAASMDHDVIMTPGQYVYLDHYQGDSKIEPVAIGGYTSLEDVYKYNPTPDTLTGIGKDQYIKGVQCNIWTEYIYNTDLLEYRMYPRTLALAEIAWTPVTRKDYKDFERRLDNALVRLDMHEINYHIPLPEQPKGSCDFVAFTDKASLTFTTSIPEKMVYTIDGTEPTEKSTVYSGPIEFTQSGVLKIRSVLLSGKMSKVRTIKVEKQTLASAKEVTKTTPGLNVQTIDSMFLSSDKMGDISKWKKSVIKDLKELAMGLTDNNEEIDKIKNHAAVATGYVNIPEDGVYYISSDNEEVWIDGKLLISNNGEVKRFSRHDSSVALAKGLHEIKIVFLGHIIGGWPSEWNDGSVSLRKADTETFTPITPSMLSH